MFLDHQLTPNIGHASTSCAVWLLFVKGDMFGSHDKAAQLFYDNQGSTHIVDNLVFHERTKYIKIDITLVLVCSLQTSNW